MSGHLRVGRPDTVVVDRFAIANAAFWLDMVACWVDDPAHADQLAAALRATLRATLNADPDHLEAAR